MPVFLEPPRHTPAGPDGAGWNRLSLNAHMGTPRPQCALQPTDYPTLWESRDTRRARWGKFGHCSRQGACRDCPLLGARHTLAAFTDEVLVRVDRQGHPWLMNRPEDGWGSRGHRWTWTDLAALDGWSIGRRANDEFSEAFWLVRMDGTSTEDRSNQ